MSGETKKNSNRNNLMIYDKDTLIKNEKHNQGIVNRIFDSTRNVNDKRCSKDMSLEELVNLEGKMTGRDSGLLSEISCGKHPEIRSGKSGDYNGVIHDGCGITHGHQQFCDGSVNSK